MDRKYINLFRELAHSTEILAEKVATSEYKGKTDEKTQSAIKMRDEYAAMYDRLRDENFDDTSLTRNDFAKLLIANGVVVGNLNTRKEILETTIKGYQDTIMPMLQRVYDESTTDEEAQAIAQQIFVINNPSFNETK